MITEIQRQTKFKKDIKRLKKQGKDFSLLKEILEQLCKDESLAKKYFDHPLKGKYKEFRECHIEPDWLLIYKKTETTLILVRSGSHAELFTI